MSEETDYRQLAEELFRALASFFWRDTGHAYFCRSEEHAAFDRQNPEGAAVSSSTERCIHAQEVYLRGRQLFAVTVSDGDYKLDMLQQQLARMQVRLMQKDVEIRRLKADADAAGLDTKNYEQLESDYHALQDAYTRLEERKQQPKHTDVH